MSVKKNYYTYIACGLSLFFLCEVNSFAQCLTANGEQKTDSFCRNSFGQEKLTQLLKNKKISTPDPIQLNATQGGKLDDTASNCKQLTDITVDGEHFAVADNVQLSKGLHYFVFETAPTQTELYIYMIGEKSSVLFPWLNAPIPQEGWNKFGSNQLQPVFSEMETDNATKAERFKIAIYAPIDQKIQLRWQHGQAGNTKYQGEKNSSNICKAQLSQVVG